MDHFAKQCPCSCWPRRAPETLFITYLGVPIWLKALIFFTCKSLLKEVGLAAGEMALKSVFKDLGPKECETSVEHGAAGRQQVPRCLYPAAAAGRVKGHEPALRHQEGAHTTEGAARLLGHRAPQDTPGSDRRLSS